MTLLSVCGQHGRARLESVSSSPRCVRMQIYYVAENAAGSIDELQVFGAQMRVIYLSVRRYGIFENGGKITCETHWGYMSLHARVCLLWSVE